LRIPLVGALVLALILLPVWMASAFAKPTELEEVEKLIELGRHEQALERLAEVLQADPDNVQALFMQGLGLAEVGRIDEAIAVLSELRTEHPELSQPLNNLAVLHAMRGDFEEAREVLLAAIQAQPDNARYHENLADVYVELAGRSYRKAIELGPSDSRAGAKLGVLEAVSTAPPGDGAKAGVARVPDAESPGSSGPAPERSEAQECAGAVARVEAWAEAWARQDVDGYLGAYAADYSGAAGLSPQQWAAVRRQRVERPRSIEVTLQDLEVELCAARRARLSFTQHYRSDTYHDRVRKELRLSRPEKTWMIIEERTLD
jgi:hypothetical protein